MLFYYHTLRQSRSIILSIHLQNPHTLHICSFHKITIIAVFRISFLPSSIMHSWIHCSYLGAYVRSSSGQSYDHLFVVVVFHLGYCVSISLAFFDRVIALHVFFLISDPSFCRVFLWLISFSNYRAFHRLREYITNGSKCNCTYKPSSGFDRCEGLLDTIHHSD